MKIFNALRLLMIAFIATFISCAHKGEPSKQGILLTPQQMQDLDKDQSMNGKVVMVEGFASLCNSMFVDIGKKNKMAIYSDGSCEGKKLIDAKIEISREGSVIFGEQDRNRAVFSDYKNPSEKTMSFTTDDYQDVPNKKLRFSGTLIYNGNGHYLDNVTIHN